MIFLGDVHGKFDKLKIVVKHLTKEHPEQTILQVGDYGIGFGPQPPKNLGKNFKFFPGNHDDRKLCLKDPHCLGNFGHITEESVYYISGAYSPDRAMRIEGINWWANEELTENELNLAGVGVETLCPKIIVTHDFPRCIIPDLFGYNPYHSRTGVYLEAIFAKYQPKYWVGGHHHKNVQKEIGGTRFICLSELSHCII